MAEDSGMKHINEAIDKALRTYRPDRYVVDSEEADDYLGLVEIEIEGLIPEAQATQMLAHALVKKREGAATRRVNTFLRSMYVDGQYMLPFGWQEFADQPVSVRIETTDDAGLVVIREERVALRAMMPMDWLTFEREGRARADRTHAAEMLAMAAAAWLREQQGGRSFYIFAMEELPPGHEDDTP